MSGAFSWSGVARREWSHRPLPVQAKVPPTLVSWAIALLRQRIALARALLREPRLLLLDETTNAIDADGEARILRTLRDLPRRPTIVMIAHREVSFAHVERVIRLSEGRIVSDRPPGSAYG